MPHRAQRNPDSASGDWYVDNRCIDCAAAREVAPGLIIHRGGKSVFARQPATPEEEAAAWCAALLCPTASIGTAAGEHPQPPHLFPQPLAPGVYRCGYNARSSFGAHSYLARRAAGNVLIDSPRFTRPLVDAIREWGGLAEVLLTHRDDVADAGRYAQEFGARVWIHEEDAAAAPYATNLLRGYEATSLGADLIAIAVPGHTRGSVAYLWQDEYLFTGDSLAWSHATHDLAAFREVCWYSWAELRKSLSQLTNYAFSWVLPGHGHSVHLPRDDMQARLRRLAESM
jgi:glyoxylase-like metal-dependent hydrolase (beta-lactamase superfamily II)